MKTNMRASYLAEQLTKAHEKRVAERRIALQEVDAMALALPAGFVWPAAMRRAYERAVKALQ